ncbi:MAG: DUF58 domain-containing protein [Gemmatimonadota bacterium]|nr:MAG: DUF58 domain-containing protein [Gemmatimonadota bacterium]
MMLPTPRALLLLGCVAALGLFGFLTPRALDVLLTVDAALLLAVVIDARLAVDPRRLTVTRQGPAGFSVGRPVDYVYRWENHARRDASLVLREVRPQLLGGVLQPRHLRVAARGRVLDSVRATPIRRGRETAGWFAVRSRGPLGLGQRQRRLDAPWTVTVYPSLPISRLKASIADAARRPEAGLRQARRLGEGSQFESLREWVPGDDTRHIDWKATARRSKVIARQFEEERRQQVLLVLDAGRLLTADVGGESRMEHSVRAALWLALAAYHHDDNIGIMVLADEIMHYVAPQRGKRGLRQVLDVLAVAQPRLVEPDYPAAFRYLAIKNRKRALTIFFTDVIDRMASEVLLVHVGSLRPRHLPLVVTLRDPELERVADGRPAAIGDAYRKAAAEELLTARDEALAQMRRLGAVVLDVCPNRASAAVVDKYLELKRRGRL